MAQRKRRVNYRKVFRVIAAFKDGREIVLREMRSADECRRTAFIAQIRDWFPGQDYQIQTREVIYSADNNAKSQ